MIRLNKLTDYAIVILSQMASQPDLMANSTQLSESTGVPNATVAKVLKQLSAAKLITSHRGVTGGYRMTLTTQAISMRAIIEAIDGPISITDCVTSNDEACCSAMGKCPVRGKWDKVNAAIIGALDGVTLQDMIATCPTSIKLKKTIQIGGK
jgi:FeS assembly SUF system regulator